MRNSESVKKEYIIKAKIETRKRPSNRERIKINSKRKVAIKKNPLDF